MSHKPFLEDTVFAACMNSHLSYGELNSQPVPYIAITMTLHL